MWPTSDPDRFTIRFDDGARIEVWHDDRGGRDLVLLDGRLLDERDVAPLDVEGLGSTPYTPERFTAGMSVEELLAVTGQGGYAEQPIDVDGTGGGRLIVVRGLVAGFDADGLAYVETIPLEST